MNAYQKIKLKLFLMNLIFNLIVNGAILFIAIMTDTLLETLLFYIPFCALRYAVPKVFHIRTKKPIISILGCGICSTFVFYIAGKLMLPINISILSSVLVGMLINYILYVIEDYMDLKKEKANLLLKLCNMTDDELRAYATSKHLSESLIDTLVLRIKYNYRWCDIQKEKNYSKDGVRYHKETLKKVLGIDL